MPLTFSDALEVIKAAGTLVAGFGFSFGAYQYCIAQRWKRQEFCAAQWALLKADPQASSALQMLDWADRDICLFPEREDVSKRTVHVTRAMLARALRPHPERKTTPFSEEEARIRDYFDALLDHLTRLNIFVEQGLISHIDLRPYVQYWVGRFRKGIIDESAGESSLLRYIEFYEYTGLIAMLGRYGFTWTLRPYQARNETTRPVGETKARIVDSESGAAPELESDSKATKRS